MRDLSRNDLFFLLVYILNRKDIIHPWLLERCKEVEASPDGYLDLWARDHRKSSIITYAKSIQDILSSHGNDPDPKWNGVEISIGIFSVTRPLAKQFLAQIKREFENNNLIKTYFPDIVWQNPDKESPSWSLDSGIFLRRKANKKEATVEAWGLIDGQPTSKHFDLLVYDDVVTVDNVRSPAMIDKTTQAWEMSLSLGTAEAKYRYIGTRYHFCLAAETRIMMEDWSHKPISTIRPGDTVVGWVKENGRRWLKKSKVLNVGKHENQAVNQYSFSTGQKVIATPTHKWWRGPHGSGEEYKELGLDYHSMKGVRRLCDLTEKIDCRRAGWLAGIFDGEGTFRKNSFHPSGTISICQTMLNPTIIDQIRESLEYFGFEYVENWCYHENNKWHDRCNFILKGGWRDRYRFLREIAPNRFKKIAASLYGQLVTDKVIITSIDSYPNVDVYWIETETGNYIAEGFCSKNSDTYKTIMDRGAAIPRLHPATIDGQALGEPVLLPKETIAQKRRDMGIYTFNSQMLLNPVADDSQGFKNEWLVFHSSTDFSNMNRYILVDPANEKKKQSDYTVMMVIGLGRDSNYYILDMVRDRLSLTERAAILFRLHRKHKPKAVGYEQYGMQADIAHIKDKMRQDNYNFKIIELGGNLAKVDRIRSLIPLFEQNRIYLPDTCYKTNYEKKTEDLTDIFIAQEYQSFPVSTHDDMLDTLARINDVDLNIIWPKFEDNEETTYIDDSGSAWSA